MVSILDIADDEFPFKIRIRGKEVDAYPLALDDIFHLFRKFPSLLVALTDAQALSGEVIGSIVNQSPDMLAEIIAASQRDKDDKSLRGDEAAIKKAKRIPATDQLEAVNEILRASFSEGFGPFDQQLARLVGLFVTKKGADGQPAASGKPSQYSWTAELVGTPPPMRRRRRPASSTLSTSATRPSTTDESPTMPRPPAPPDTPSSSTSPAT